MIDSHTPPLIVRFHRSLTMARTRRAIPVILWGQASGAGRSYADFAAARVDSTATGLGVSSEESPNFKRSAESIF